MFAKKSLFRNQFLNHALVFCVIFVMSGFGALFVNVDTALAARECVSTGTTSDWNTSSTWLCGGTPAVPVAEDNITISHAVTIGDYTINEVNNITIASGGTLTQSNSSTQTIAGDLLVQSGGTLTHTAHVSGDGSNIVYTVDFQADNITVNSGGSISADSKGHAGGYNYHAGYGPGGGEGLFGDAGAGGAHCGDGGNGYSSTIGGTAYCERTNPMTMGSGGGSFNGAYGGWGGGLIVINANNLITIYGDISADGQNAVTGGGGGAGGTINLTASTVQGAPNSMTATGGIGSNYAQSYDGGGGGGGVIYIYTDDFSLSFDNASVLGGGNGGGAGEGGSDGIFNLEKVNPDLAGSTCNSLIYGVWDRIFWSCGRLPLATDDIVIDNDVTIETDFIIPAIDDLTISENYILTQSNSSTQTITGDLIVEGTLTHTAHTADDGSSILYAVNFAVDNLIISSTGIITADAKGHAGGYNYHAGYGPGGGGGLFSSAGAGGAHRGAGGNGNPSTIGGVPYYFDTPNPMTMGSGGGSFNGAYGGWGGGLIVINANNLITINGSISADGQNGVTAGGGGAGGTINLTANTVDGDPTSMTVTGGTGHDYAQSYDGGGGGGGVIYILYSIPISITSSSPFVDFSGGVGGGLGEDGLSGIFIPSLLEGGGGGGGEGVPEFSTLIYLTTIIFAFGALYKSQKRFNFTNVRIP